MEECHEVFNAIDNPKQKLALMIAYGAGLRVNEVVNLRWSNVLHAEQKILLKMEKAKKTAW